MFYVLPPTFGVTNLVTGKPLPQAVRSPRQEHQKEISTHSKFNVKATTDITLAG
jgi:hypothetical protein